MADQGYAGVRDVENGVPRGMDGLTTAWDANQQRIEDEIQEKYSREKWGSLSGSYDKATAAGAEAEEQPLTEAELRRKYGSAPVEDTPTHPNLPGTL
jgi:hypothetical protein